MQFSKLSFTYTVYLLSSYRDRHYTMVQLCDQSSGSTGLCLLHLESRVTVTQPQAEEQSDYETNSAIRLSVQKE